MRILGIDPGLRLTGYGVLDYHVLKPRLIDAGVIRLKPKTSLADRLVDVRMRARTQPHVAWRGLPVAMHDHADAGGIRHQQVERVPGVARGRLRGRPCPQRQAWRSRPPKRRRARATQPLCAMSLAVCTSEKSS